MVGGVREGDLPLTGRPALGLWVLVLLVIVLECLPQRLEKVVEGVEMAEQREGIPWASLLLPHCLGGQGVVFVSAEG